MNADELLRHYERIADAPEAVARLRAFVVELAVRGRLFGSRCEAGSAWPQLPLARLLAEDTRNGYSRRPDDAPDGVPILRISAGTVRADGIVAEEEHKLISGIDASTRELYGLKAGDLLACRFNGNKRFVGSLSLFKDYSGLRPIYPDKLIRIRLERSLVEPRFLLVAASSAMVRERVETMCATTVGNWGISASNLKTVRFPVPPLAEQRRIVAKVDELMALCDRLEAARAQREAARGRLARSCLARLDTPDPETFRDDARFALDALPALTARPDQVRPLRQTILNLAVRGKLVPQHPIESTAEPSDDGAAVHAVDAPEIPAAWRWMRIETLCEAIVDCPHSTPTFVSGGVVCLDTNAFKNGAIVSTKIRYVSEETYKERVRRLVPQAGDIVFAREGSVGESVIVPDGLRCCLGQRVMLFRPGRNSTSRYFQLALSAPSFLSALMELHKGIGAKHVNVSDMRVASIPLPPLAEQHRIVAKVDELMALCDQLEASLTRADEHRRRLLEALLHKALEPARLQEQAA